MSVVEIDQEGPEGADAIFGSLRDEQALTEAPEAVVVAADTKPRKKRRPMIERDLVTLEVDLQAIANAIDATRPLGDFGPGDPQRYLPFLIRAICVVARRVPEVVGLTETSVDAPIDIGLRTDAMVGRRVLEAVDTKRIRTVAGDITASMGEPPTAAEGSIGVSVSDDRPPMLRFPMGNDPHSMVVALSGVAPRPVIVGDSTGCQAVATHMIGVIGGAWSVADIDADSAEDFLVRLKDTLESRQWDVELD